MNAGLDGDPPRRGLRLVDAVASTSDRLTGRSLNVAPRRNTPVRIAALGWDDQPADAAAIDDQRSVVREAMEHGAVGLSSGLDYPPGAYATTDELAALANEVAKLGGFYHTHVRYGLGDRFLDPFREAIEIGRRGEAPAHITHFYHRQTFPGTPDQMLDLVDAARAAGQDVTFDAYPYEWASTRLLILIPIWVQDGGPAKTMERLADRAVRERIRDDLTKRGQLYAGSGGLRDVRLGQLDLPHNRPFEGRTLGELIDDRGADPVDVLCDLLVEERLRPNEVTPGPHTDGIRRFLRNEHGMVGTDSTFVGDKPSPRTYGSTRGSSASSCATRGSWGSRRPSAG